MIGKNIFEDADIDAAIIEQQIEEFAKELFEEYKGKLDEIDVLQMNNASGDARGLILQAVLKLIKDECIIIERSKSL